MYRAGFEAGDSADPSRARPVTTARRVVLTARAAGVCPVVEPSVDAGPAAARAPATSSRCRVPRAAATNAQEATRQAGPRRAAREEQL